MNVEIILKRETVEHKGHFDCKGAHEQLIDAMEILEIAVCNSVLDCGTTYLKEQSREFAVFLKYSWLEMS